MDIDAGMAARRLLRRQKETGTVGDIHEKDVVYLESCSQCGRQAAAHYGWHGIDCLVEGRERSEDDIHQEIYSVIYNFET